MFSLFSTQKGSVTLLLALSSSIGALSTAYMSPSTYSWLSTPFEANSFEKEQQKLTFIALKLSEHLVTNNFVLCKDKGWKNHDSLCIWNPKKASPGHFQLKPVLAQKTKALQFEGIIKPGPLSPFKTDKRFFLQFDLLESYGETFQSLIGTLPKFQCRHSKTSNILAGTCRKKKSHCLDASNTIKRDTFDKPIPCECQDLGQKPIEHSICEKTSPHSETHSVALTLKIPNPSSGAPPEDGIKNSPSRYKEFHLGFKRPQSTIWLSPKTKPACSVSCPMGSARSAHKFQTCVGPLKPMRQWAPFTMEVKNIGPGTLYYLSLSRTDFFAQIKNNLPHQNKITGDLISLAGKEMLHPGESLIFHDTIDCQNLNLTSLFQDQKPKNNTWNLPYLNLFYTLNTASSRMGVCMRNRLSANIRSEVTPSKNEELLIKHPSIPFAMENQKGGFLTCQGKEKKHPSTGLTCGPGGRCLYSGAEPWIKNTSFIAQPKDKARKPFHNKNIFLLSAITASILLIQ